MRGTRRLLRSARFQRLLGWAAAQYIRLVYYTSRFTLVGRDETVKRVAENPRFFLLWHNRLAMMPMAWKYATGELTILASNHRDGTLVARALSHFGIGTISVTSKTVNLRAARSIIDTFKGGSCIGMTPDGPRGPKMRLKPTSLHWARKCSAEVDLIAYSVKRRIVLRSWDQFMIPLPFNRGIIMAKPGCKLENDMSDADLAVKCHQLEDMLIVLTQECDRRMGHPVPTEYNSAEVDALPDPEADLVDFKPAPNVRSSTPGT